MIQRMIKHYNKWSHFEIAFKREERHRIIVDLILIQELIMKRLSVF